MSKEPIKSRYEVPYPFVRTTAQIIQGEDEYGPILVDIESWRPGTRVEPIAPDDVINVADAQGAMILNVVSTHKPGKYPTRVFFTRKWRDPDGKEFGKGRLHIYSVGKFRQLVSGFLYDFEWADDC